MIIRVIAVIVLLAVSFISAIELKAAEDGTSVPVMLSDIKLNSDTIAFGHGSLWISRRFDVVCIDACGILVAEIKLVDRSIHQRAPAIGETAVWSANVGSDTLFNRHLPDGNV